MGFGRKPLSPRTKVEGYMARFWLKRYYRYMAKAAVRRPQTHGRLYLLA